MANSFLIKSKLGKLQVIEVFEYYDGPVFFSCESLSSQKYLALWVDALDSFDRWFYLPISDSRLSSVKQGIISLHDCFKEPEDGWLWEVKIYHDTGQEDLDPVLSKYISDDDLPDKDEYLNLEERRLPESKETTIIDAERKGREIFDLALEPFGTHSTEVDSDHLGLVLFRLQALVRSLGHKNNNTRGRVPKLIEEENTLRVTGFFAASFGIRLESKYGKNLFGFTEVSSALNLLMDLLEAKDNRDRLLEVLQKISPKSIARYRFLLKALRDGQSSANVKWFSPSKVYRKVSIARGEIQSVLNLLKEEGKDVSEIYTLEGTLVGINKNKKSFEFHSFDGDKFAGTLSEELVDTQFKVELDVKANIEETLELSPLTQEERVTYKLISVFELNKNNDTEKIDFNEEKKD